MVNPQPAAGYQSLWNLIHTGGLTVETFSTTTPNRPALRSLLQLDGDHLLSVDLSALADLTPRERLRLAAQHRMKLHAQTKALKSPALTMIPWLRRVSWVAAGGLTGLSLRPTLILHPSLHSLEPAVGALLLWALPRGLPWLLRQLNGTFHEAFHLEQRAVSHAVYEKLKKGIKP